MAHDKHGWVQRKGPRNNYSFYGRQVPDRHSLAWNEQEDRDLLNAWSRDPDAKNCHLLANQHARTEGAILGRLWKLTMHTLTPGVLSKIIKGEMPKDPELILEVKPSTRQTHIGVQDILLYRVLLNGFCVKEQAPGGWDIFQEHQSKEFITGLAVALGVGYTAITLKAVKTTVYEEAERCIIPPL